MLPPPGAMTTALPFAVQVFGATHGDFDASVAELTRQLTIHAKVGEEVGNAIAASTGWTFAGVDPTPAPLGDASIGDAIERYTGGKFVRASCYDVPAGTCLARAAF